MKAPRSQSLGIVTGRYARKRPMPEIPAEVRLRALLKDQEGVTNPTAVPAVQRLFAEMRKTIQEEVERRLQKR